MTANEANAAQPNIETEGMIVEVETHAPHAHKTGHNWVDLVVAISALFVSLVSLGIGILHGRTMERMAEANARLVAANSWPFMAYGGSLRRRILEGKEVASAPPLLLLTAYNVKPISERIRSSSHSACRLLRMPSPRCARLRLSSVALSS